MNRLQKALRLNAIFSGISGIMLIALHNPIARLFEIESSAVFWIIGIALIFFAGTIAYEIIKQRWLAVLWIIIQDFLWVLGSLILLAIEPFEISKAGNLIIAVVALVVLFMGINQLKTLLQVKQSSKAGK